MLYGWGLLSASLTTSPPHCNSSTSSSSLHKNHEWSCCREVVMLYGWGLLSASLTSSSSLHKNHEWSCCREVVMLYGWGLLSHQLLLPAQES